MPQRPLIPRDEVAYLLPFAAFMLLLWVGSTWKSLYVPSYIARVVLVPILLYIGWPNYTKIRWNHWWLGLIVGVIGIFQWVPMQLWLQNNVAFFAPAYVCERHENVTGKGPGVCTICNSDFVSDAFNPFKQIADPKLAWAFIVVRMIGAVLVVPVMEELFWRDGLWRSIIAPNDFKLARVGEFEWPAFLVVVAAFAMVHGNWWLTAVVWGGMVGVLLVYTKSLGACIIAHATTNLLLALYVLKYEDWAFW